MLIKEWGWGKQCFLLDSKELQCFLTLLKFWKVLNMKQVFKRELS